MGDNLSDSSFSFFYWDPTRPSSSRFSPAFVRAPVLLTPLPPPTQTLTSGVPVALAPTSHAPYEPSVEDLILALDDENLREASLQLLSKSKNKPANFAVLLWHSVGTPSIILREVTAVYGFLCPPTLTMDKANRVCNAIALFQYVASDALTRPQFLKARMVYYLFPFIMLAENNKPYEYLRLSSLGVVGALLKSEDPEVVPHLLEIEGFPFFLHALEAGSQLSKTVAVFIIHKILMDDLGLHYCCGVAERFFTIARAFQRVVEKLVAEMIERLPNEASLKLLKNMIRCYLRMCECPRVRDGLSICLPSCFKNDAISYVLHEDPIALGWVQQILFNVTSAERVRAQAAAEASERALRINLENLNIRG